MKNYSFLLVIALLVVCALAGNSDASYKSFSSNPALQNLTLPATQPNGGTGNTSGFGLWARPNTYIMFGDSFMAQQSASGTTEAAGGYPLNSGLPLTNGSYSTNNQGFVIAGMSFAGHPFAFVGNYGHSGDTTTQMLARINVPLAKGAALVIMDGGINDPVNSVSVATTIANLTSMYKQFNATGTQVIDITSPATLTDTQNLKQQKFQVNRFKVDYARKNPGVRIFNLASLLLDTSSIANSYGTPLSTLLQVDGVHPDALAAWTVLGPAFASFLENNYPSPQAYSPWSNVNQAITSGDILDQIIPNPMMIQGSGGSASGGVTGTVAQYWSAFRGSGTIVATASIVTRASLASTFPIFNDGLPGYVQELDLSGGGANDTMVLQPNITTNPASGSGPWIMDCEIAFNITSGTMDYWNTFINMPYSGGTAQVVTDNNGGTGAIGLPVGTYGIRAQSLPFVIPNGLTSFGPSLNFHLSAAGTTKVYVANCQMYQLQY